AGKVYPELIIGLPVGFVGAEESKNALAASGLHVPFITNMGRKGGSNVAAAVVNALAILAASQQ
ncbi:MAG: precorrin-8X methylmutase, partial [Deltaproteobacteria bacterium]|nr:precorrin-8X methylmutase [Deltaproteobacteria bacterium]